MGRLSLWSKRQARALLPQLEYKSWDPLFKKHRFALQFLQICQVFYSNLVLHLFFLTQSNSDDIATFVEGCQCNVTSIQVKRVLAEIIGKKIKAQNMVVVVMPKTVLWPISSSCLNAGVIFTTPPSTLPVVKVNTIHAMIFGVYMQLKSTFQVSQRLSTYPISYLCCHMPEIR